MARRYRLYPEAVTSVQIQDIAEAVRWTALNAMRFGGDPNQVCGVWRVRVSSRARGSE
jgi:acetyl esterase/lipase